MADVERRIVDTFWDLRDDAYDHPDRWLGVTPEILFQQLAGYVQEAEDREEGVDWREVAERMIVWRAGEG